MSLLKSIIKESLSARVEVWGVNKLNDYLSDLQEKNPKEFKRFIPKRGGDYGSDDLKYFSLDDVGWMNREGESVFFVVLIGERIVGIAKLQKSPHERDIERNLWWTSYITVDPKYQGMGHSRLLVDALFKYAKEHNIVIQGSSRSKMGQERLGHLIDQYSKKYGVEYIPSEDRFYE